MKRKIDLPILLMALFCTVLHLLFIGNLEYHRDELLYFSLGQHPAFGYASVPPLIGWIAWLMEHLFGYSLFAVRIFPAAMSGIMVWLVSSLAVELGGKHYAKLLAGLGIIIPVFALRSFSLYMPVQLELFFWTLAIFLVIKYINTDLDKYLLIFGVVAGIALLNKYLIGLLFLIMLMIIPFTPHRKILGKKMFWVGLAAGAIIFLPNIIWQITHGMPVFRHMSELASTQLTHVDRTSFLVEQITSPGAASILTVAGIIYLLVNRSAARYRFLGLAVIGVILSLMLLHGKSYYTQGVFPFLIAAGAVSYESIFIKWYTRTVLPLVLVILTIMILPFGLPVFKTEGLKKYFDHLESAYGVDLGRTFEDATKHSLPQDYADMLGWEELTALTNKAYRMIEDKSSSFIYAENYGQAGAITVIGKKYNLPEAVSFSESFVYWFPRQFKTEIKSGIYINHELGEDVGKIFSKITEIGKISDPDAREFGATVYLLQDPVISFNQFWNERTRSLDR
jgi:hypothetical protein